MLGTRAYYEQYVDKIVDCAVLGEPFYKENEKYLSHMNGSPNGKAAMCAIIIDKPKREITLQARVDEITGQMELIEKFSYSKMSRQEITKKLFSALKPGGYEWN